MNYSMSGIGYTVLGRRAAGLSCCNRSQTFNRNRTNQRPAFGSKATASQQSKRECLGKRPAL